MPELELRTVCPDSGDAMRLVLKPSDCRALRAQVIDCSGCVELALMSPDIFTNSRNVPKVARGLTNFFLRILSESTTGAEIVQLAKLSTEDSFLLNGENAEKDNDIAFWVGEDFCGFLKTQQFKDGQIIVNEDQLRAFVGDIIAKFEAAEEVDVFRRELIRM